MGTKKSSGPKNQSNISDIFNTLLSEDVSEPKNFLRPQKGLDEEVGAIYKQAYDHRSKLINFYIFYTIIMSIAIFSIIFFQIQVKLINGNEDLEIVSPLIIELLVVGMFGQFIGLLAIVTRKVWTFEPFLKHHRLKKDQ